MRAEKVTLDRLHDVEGLLTFYMGKNTPNRQDFIIGNLRAEKDLIET
jgi:topoisomerase-4 subunit B